MEERKMNTPVKVLIGFILFVIGLFSIGPSFGFSVLMMSLGIFMIVFSIIYRIAIDMRAGSARRTLYITCCVISTLILLIGLGLFNSTHGGLADAIFGMIFVGIGGISLISVICAIVFVEISIKNTRRQ